MSDYSSSFIFFADVDEVKMALEKVGIKDRTILIKGSNSMRLYTLVESL